MASQSQSQSQPSLFFSVSDKRRQTTSSGQRPRQAHRRTPTCSFCKEQGHMVNDREGNTACPKLLATECRYCHKTGHILSHCPLLKNKQEGGGSCQRPQRQQQESHQPRETSDTIRFSAAFTRLANETARSTSTPAPGRRPRPAPLATSSRFAALVDDSDEESDAPSLPSGPGPRPAQPQQTRGAWGTGRLSMRSRVSPKVMPVMKDGTPVPTAPAKKAVSFRIENDFANEEEEVPQTPPPTPTVIPTVTPVDFKAFLGDVSDAWADEEEKESSDVEEDTTITDGW